MRKTLILTLTAVALAAQSPLDTPQVRVTTVTIEPHQIIPPEEHPMNRVLIYRDAGHMQLSSQDGRIEDIEFNAGDVRWSPRGAPYMPQNVTDKTIHIVEIELKNMPAAPPPALTKLDAPIVDARHYKVEFENNQVRVLRIHFEPHEKSALHEHQFNRVVCYLNDQATFKAGDVRVAGPATHTEQNAGDTPADRIAVELKY